MLSSKPNLIFFLFLISNAKVHPFASTAMTDSNETATSVIEVAVEHTQTAKCRGAVWVKSSIRLPLFSKLAVSSI